MTPLGGDVPASAQAPFGLRLSSPGKTVALVLLLLSGAALLLYKFPSVPVGLHQDEMSEAYEAYALLHTGADRWGYHLPVYFVSWGSGQNVLQAYLSVPVIALTGLTRVGARFIPILCGLLTLPLFFYTLRRWAGENVALLGLAFLALSPWHIMESRWGIENSPLPFFLLLGVYTFSRALQSGSRWLTPFSLLPFVLALYTYGLVIVVVPGLVVLLLLIDPGAVLKRRRAWAGALLIFTVCSLPIGFFTLKNYVLKKNYSFERHLPFTVPLLPASRLNQSRDELVKPTVLGHNLYFIRNGFTVRGIWFHIWFQLPDVRPVQPVVLVMALFGLVWLLARAVRARHFEEPFLPWLLACVPLLFLMPLNTSRSMAIFLPVLALAAMGTAKLFTSLLGFCKQRMETAFVVVLAAACAWLFLRPMVRFVHEYYGSLYATDVAPTLNPELPAALALARQLAGPAEPLFVTDTISLNYVQVLFLTSTDPVVFQRSGATYLHPDFGAYRFSRESLSRTPLPFVFLIRSKELPVCSNPMDNLTVGQFVVGRCE